MVVAIKTIFTSCFNCCDAIEYNMIYLFTTDRCCSFVSSLSNDDKLFGKDVHHKAVPVFVANDHCSSVILSHTGSSIFKLTSKTFK